MRTGQPRAAGQTHGEGLLPPWSRGRWWCLAPLSSGSPMRQRATKPWLRGHARSSVHHPVGHPGSTTAASACACLSSGRAFCCTSACTQAIARAVPLAPIVARVSGDPQIYSAISASILANGPTSALSVVGLSIATTTWLSTCKLIPGSIQTTLTVPKEEVWLRPAPAVLRKVEPKGPLGWGKLLTLQ